MSDKEQQITDFVAVTGIDRDRARFYLESSAWNLDVAMESFYDDAGDDDPSAGPGSSPTTAAPTRQPDAPKSSSGSRFATLANYAEKEGDSDSEEGQAFYAGGSEHSGQQVLGPPRKKKQNTDELVQSMFEAAKEHGAEEVAAGSTSEKKAAPTFIGAGYRLGDTQGGPIQKVMGAARGQSPQQVDMVLKLWKTGFSVDDGPLRDYQDPQNKEFLSAINKGEIPSELLRLAKGGEVNLNMEDHRHEEYVKPKVQVKAFSGTGNVLGSPTPGVEAAAPSPSGASSAGSQAMPVKLDESQATTQLQIRLADGSRLVAKFNNTHTVADVRQYIISSRPDVAGGFVLMTTFPNKEITDETQTLQDAKLLNAVLVQKRK